MKQMLFIFLLSLSISGCSILTPSETLDEPPSTAATVIETEPTSAESETKESISLPLLPSEHIHYLDDAHILAQVSNTTTENARYSSLLFFAGEPLLYWPEFTDDGNVTIFLKRLDLSSDSVPFEISLPAKSYYPPIAEDETLIITDNPAGNIYLFDRDLSLTQTLTFEPNYENWYLSKDRQFLYQLDYNKGLTATEIATGQTETLLDPTANVYPLTTWGSTVSFSYTDPDTHLNTVGCLDLIANTFTPCPYDIELLSLAVCDDLWVGQIYGNGRYLIASDNEPMVTSIENGMLFLVAPTKHLLVTDYGSQTMTLYMSDGTFISSCSLAALGPYASPATELFWSEADGGYFFLTHDEEGFGQLLFWDISVPMEGDHLSLVSLDTYHGNGGSTVALKDLYERAASMSETYDVNIRIADQCESSYTDFDAVIVYDAEMLSWALDDLEKVLSTYPSGFFSQLRYEHIREIEINLMGSLTATNDYYDNGFYNAFAEPIGNKHRIVVDIYTSSQDTIHHELSHVIDGKLAWDAARREDALFSEDHWLSLSPEGFSYTYAYVSNWDENMRPEWSGYFIDGYAIGFPTEDRARVWEYALGGYDWYFEDAPGLKAKLAYYSECIRDCFDTTGWPKVLPWEELLSN